MMWGKRKKDKQPYIKKQYKNPLAKIIGSAKSKGGRSHYSLIPLRTEKGNAYNTELPKSATPIIINNSSGMTLSTRRGQDPYVHVGNYDMYFAITPHFGKKTFGLEVEYCKQHEKQNERDHFTGKDCYGGYELFSTRVQPLLDYLKKKHNVIFINDEKKLARWEREKLIEFDEPEPQSHPIEKKRDRALEKIDRFSKQSINDAVKYSNFNNEQKRELRKTLEGIIREVHLQIDNHDWVRTDINEITPVLEGMTESTFDLATQWNENDLEHGTHSKDSFERAQRITKEFTRGIYNTILRDFLAVSS